MSRSVPASALRTALALVAAGAVLTACSTPPWQESAAPGPTGATALRPSVSASAGRSVGPTGAVADPSTGIVRNDLASGSLHHTRTAGAIKVRIDYWSTLSMSGWTPAANKPLSMAVSASLPPGTPAKQAVYLSKVTVTPTVDRTAEGAAGPRPLVDAATVSPGYTLRRPSSYQQTFTLPALDPEATSVTLQINYEMLLQTTPSSRRYAKQTASDTVTIALA